MKLTCIISYTVGDSIFKWAMAEIIFWEDFKRLVKPNKLNL